MVALMSATAHTLPTLRGAGPAAVRATLVLLLLGFTALLTPAAARAHDTLIETSPGQDAVVEDAPTEVTLTFSAEVLDLPTTMVVTAADGDVVAEGTPAVDGQAVRLSLPSILPDGEYEVTWSVVSSDGHRTEDTYTFTLAADDDAAPPEPAAESAATPTAQPSAHAPGASPAPDTDADAQARGEDGWMPSWTAILNVQAGIMLLAVAVALGYKRWRTGR